MDWFTLIFSFSDVEILVCLWMHWLLWVLMFLPPKIFTVDRLHMGGLGLALPGMVFIVEGEPIATLHHEHTHTLQMRRYSPTGVAIYLGWHYGTGLVWQQITGRPIDFWTLWKSNRLEREANDRMYDSSTPLCIEPVAVVHFLLFSTFLTVGTAWMI